MEVKEIEIMNRREYTKEFKQEAVELSYRQGGAKAAASLGIAANTLYCSFGDFCMSKEKGRILKGVQSISGGKPYGYSTRFYVEV